MDCQRYDVLLLYENYLFPNADKQMRIFKMRKKQEVESDGKAYNRMHNKWLKEMIKSHNLELE